MAKALAHRGPDGDGFELDGSLAIGHRRLSILDLSAAGRQPMYDSTGRYVVTYNGEIYNYVELGAELKAGGLDLRTRTDTEVLVEAFGKWGPAFLDRLNGMFAFAIWDRRERTLFAARDRFGEKPFFYRLIPGVEFRFASEIKALCLPGDPAPRVRREALHRFLSYSHLWRPGETYYDGILQLPPAHRLWVRDGKVRVEPYWALKADPPSPGGSETEQVEQVAELLEDSVRIRLRSDVALGTCLSGGLDSSTIVAMVARLLKGVSEGGVPRKATFSACFPESPEDEAKFMDAVVEATGVESHRTVPVPESFLEELPALLHAQDEPFSGPSIYAEYKLFELAKDRGVTVLLNGQGGDEVFGGYHYFFGDLWWHLLRTGRIVNMRSEMREYDALHGRGAARNWLRAAAKARVPWWVRRLRRRGVPWLTEDFRKSAHGDSPHMPWSLGESLLESQSYRMLPHLLRQADRNSMAFSREARLPLLDHRLVEYVFSLPDRMKLRGGTTKWALREAIRGLVPELVRGRHDKVGYGLHGAGWLRGGIRDRVRDTLSSKRVRERGVFEVPRLLELFRKMEGGEDAVAAEVWLAFLGESWLQVCIDGRGGTS